ncbi:rhodanese-like domain-containing protein [Limibaculum sp. M0105]|uniref:Rhodanese-like domain-containing protein n=1 Tax=Thermohalobaculum xanthum TaxID=2753746 RepID=A0A8J7SF09_9RHOB|nr:rhodanese-like domain-containing protein [Thermohalobaculum xanthum]MBK0400138.1 rhodanese-like domain-containing protein [Thermohalobaculum xanthum]
MQSINRESLQLKMGSADDLILVEVLPKDSYDEFHIPGAINVPVKSDDFAERIQAVANKNDEVVVYCQNTECDASPRAAERMEKLGFKRVFDYEAGKDDWRKAGLPIEQK